MSFTPAAPLLISRLITLFISFTVHEFSHALAATLLGDESPRREGRLTLNPLKHLDPWGVILLLVMGYGWARPVRVNSYAVQRKNRAGMMWVSLAGPLSNFLLAAIGAFLLTHGYCAASFSGIPSWLPTPQMFLNQFIQINLSLMVFNLLPIAPLDGEKVVRYFIPDSVKSGWDSFQRNGQRIMMALFFILPYLGYNFAGRFISNVTASLYFFLMRFPG